MEDEHIEDVSMIGYLVAGTLFGWATSFLGWVYLSSKTGGDSIFEDESSEDDEDNGSDDASSDQTNSNDLLLGIISMQSASIYNLTNKMGTTLGKCPLSSDEEEDIFSDDLSDDENGEIAEENPPQSSSVDSSLENNNSTELLSMFDEEHRRQSRSREEVLNIGKSIGPEPVKYYAKRGGGYASIQEVEDAGTAAESYRKNRLSRADELDILSRFSHLRNKNYFEAVELAKDDGYTLHPIYINDQPKNPASAYNGTCIGVRVMDFEYQYNGQNGVNGLSPNAKITELIDVGGQDTLNRGQIKL